MPDKEVDCFIKPPIDSGQGKNIKKCKITPRKDYVLAEGWIVSGLDETGHSEKFTDEFDVKLQVTKDTIKILPREK